MSLQKYFKNFNNKIKMDYEEKSELASKRDILLKNFVIVGSYRLSQS